MRVLLSILFCITQATISFGQPAVTTKLYFYCLPPVDVYTPDDPYHYNTTTLGRYTLLETNQDSLKLHLLENKVISLPLKAGHTYYFLRLQSTAMLTSCSEEEFWLNAYLLGIPVYRQYLFDKKAGFQLIRKERN